MWDGIAALAIAALLIVVAFELARTNIGLLIGKQANPVLVEDIRSCLREQPEVLSVVDVVTMLMGTGKVLVCARVDFIESLSATDSEHASVRLHDVLNQRFVDIEDIYIELVPRDNAAMQDKARQTRR